MRIFDRITLVLFLFIGATARAKDLKKTEADICLECPQSSSSSSPSSLQDLNRVKSSFSNIIISDKALRQIESFEKIGFLCDKDSSGLGRAIECIGKLGSYKNKMHIYIPQNFAPSEAENQISFFLHGFKSSQTFRKNKNDLDGVGDFAGILAKSKNQKAILVVPESDGQCSDYKEFIKNPHSFLKMREDVKKYTDMKSVRLTIAGHSGAYRAIDALMRSEALAADVKKIGLFDSIYDSTSSLPNIRQWLAKSQKNKIKVAYVTGAQQSTEKQTLSFLEKASAYKEQIEVIKLDSNTPTAHMQAIQNGGLSDFLK